ncbi:hypothetical protein A9R05_43075 (plasmid) [Burkholderia sp. KK1]|nr:hypothetical protein A9R05_43075 [Burkholderia sp. KK1]
MRSDVIGPFVEVDSTYGSLMVARAGSEKPIATRDEEQAVWQYGGVEYPMVLFLSSPPVPNLSARSLSTRAIGYSIVTDTKKPRLSMRDGA